MKIKSLSIIPTTCTQIVKISRKTKLRKIVISFLKVERKTKWSSKFEVLLIIYKLIQNLNNVNKPFKQSLAM
jgi:hypothetical protein